MWLLLRVCLKLHVDAVGIVRIEFGQGGESGARFALLAQDVEGLGVKIFHCRGALKGRARGIDKGYCGIFGPKETVDSPSHGGHRHEGELQFVDDAQSAVAANEQIDSVHIVFDIVAGGIFCMGHLVGRKVEFEQRTGLGFKREAAAVAAHLAAAQRQGVTVGKCYAQSRDVAAHGAVSVATCARCIACRHAAQAGRSLGWIGGEELLGAGIELVECQKARGVPSVRGDGLVGKMFAQLGEDHAGLYAQIECACIVTTKAQVGARAREVHNVSAGGHGATGKTGAAALHGDGRAGGIQFA